MKKIREHLNTIFLVVVIALTLWSVFHGEDIGQVWNYLMMANPLYIAPAVLCVVAFIGGEAVALCYLTRSLGSRVSFFHCWLYAFIGFFYSSITPSASGGQPMQVVAMRKDRIPVAVSTVVMAIMTMAYKLVLVAIGAAVLILRPPAVMAYLKPAMALVYLGLGLNVVCVAALLLLVFHPGLVRSIAQGTLSLIRRIRPPRHPERQQERLEAMIGQYTGAADYYRSHRCVIMNVFLIMLVQRCLYFFITWFTYRSFGLSGERMEVILTLQAMIVISADMIPLPGGMGVSENLFLELFLPIFGTAFVLPGMMISRGIGHYIQLLASAAMTLASSFLLRTKE